MLDHVAHRVSDLERSARFYDALFHALGARRMPAGEAALGWGVDAPVFRISVANGRPPGGQGHVALRVAGKAAVEAGWEAGRRAGGTDDGPPAPRPGEGIRCFAAHLRDPDGLRIELVAR